MYELSDKLIISIANYLSFFFKKKRDYNNDTGRKEDDIRQTMYLRFFECMQMSEKAFVL